MVGFPGECGPLGGISGSPNCTLSAFTSLRPQTPVSGKWAAQSDDAEQKCGEQRTVAFYVAKQALAGQDRHFTAVSDTSPQLEYDGSGSSRCAGCFADTLNPDLGALLTP